MCVCVWGGRKKSWSVPNKSVRYTASCAFGEKKKSMMAYSFLFGDEGRAKKKVEEEEEKKPY